MKFICLIVIFLCCMFCFPLSNFDLSNFRKDSIVVSIKGEVEEEVILTLDAYSLLEDALHEVVLTNKADVSQLNPLMVLKDGDCIVVPKIQEKSLVSINYGTMDELMSLPGIGSSKAMKIIQYRNEYGLFQSIDDLMKIDGIKQKTFDQLKDFICL